MGDHGLDDLETAFVHDGRPHVKRASSPAQYGSFLEAGADALASRPQETVSHLHATTCRLGFLHVSSRIRLGDRSSSSISGEDRQTET